MAKEKQTAHDLIYGLRKDISVAKPETGKALSEELYDAAVRGEELVCIRPFKYGGEQYQIGDRIKLEPTAKVLTPHYVTTQRRFSANREHVEKSKFYRDVIVPAESLWQTLTKNEQDAIAAYAAAQAALKQAKLELDDARGRRETQEGVIIGLFEGETVN